MALTVRSYLRGQVCMVFAEAWKWFSFYGIQGPWCLTSYLFQPVHVGLVVGMGRITRLWRADCARGLH